MADALKQTGRDVYLSLNNWGNEQITTWGGSIAPSFRTTQDIVFYSVPAKNYWQQVKSNFLANQRFADNAGPGHWNDPDLMLIGIYSASIGGAPLTSTEHRTHFALWAFAKAPLILGAVNMFGNGLEVVSNPYLIAIN